MYSTVCTECIANWCMWSIWCVNSASWKIPSQPSHHSPTPIWYGGGGGGFPTIGRHLVEESCQRWASGEGVLPEVGISQRSLTRGGHFAAQSYHRWEYGTAQLFQRWVSGGGVLPVLGIRQRGPARGGHLVERSCQWWVSGGGFLPKVGIWQLNPSRSGHLVRGCPARCWHVMQEEFLPKVGI